MGNRVGIITIASLSVLIGCVRNSDCVPVYIINVETALKTETSIFDLFEKVEVICLESPSITNNVHSGEQYYDYYNGHIYILDEASYKVNVYDTTGRKLFVGNFRGRGPGEYSMAYAIKVNQKTGTVNVLDPRGRIMEYKEESDGLTFAREVDFSKYQVATHHFTIDGDNCVLFDFTNQQPLAVFNLSTWNYRKIDYSLPEWYFKINLPHPFFEQDGKLCYFEQHDGTIYYIDPLSARLTKASSFDFGNKGCRLADIPRNETQDFYYDWISTNAKYVTPIYRIVAHQANLYANVVYDGLIHTIALYDGGASFFFEQTKEGLRFVPGVSGDGSMYTFVEFASMPEYVCPDILSEASRAAYEKIIQEQGCGLIKYSYFSN